MVFAFTRKLMNYCLIIGMLFFFGSPAVYSAPPAQIAIVIDDIGYRQTDISAINLPGNFTYGIVPFAPLTHHLAKVAFNNNKEVIAHIPMEALKSNHLLGAGAITSEMNKRQLTQQLRLAISDVPHAKGINNHMGSKLTTLAQPVHWIMEQLSRSQLYFLDSKTTVHSLGESVAAQYGIQTGHRHVFLDNELEQAAIARQFSQLLAIAKKNRSAIAIAHPHPQTIAFLNTIKQQLIKHNIELVPLSKILPKKGQLARAATTSTSTKTSYQANSSLN
jgi:polysaccharide deacetylase 2 family uncharacterized protein YibQ